MENNLEITPPQNDINLLTAQLHQQPLPPPNQLNNQGNVPDDSKQ